MIVFPLASIRSAPAGILTRFPTASIRPFRISRVAFSIAGLPVPSMMRAPTQACAGVVEDWLSCRGLAANPASVIRRTDPAMNAYRLLFLLPMNFMRLDKYYYKIIVAFAKLNVRRGNRVKTLILVSLLLASVSPLRAADPEGFGLWKGTSVKNSGKELSGKIDDQKFAWQPLGTYQNHLMGISHREGDGSAELHETQVDILIVESGEATLVVGGTMMAPKTIKPHEVRGSSIEGGEVKQLVVGDVVHIPAKVPHQLKIASGKTFTYLVVKVDSN